MLTRLLAWLREAVEPVCAGKFEQHCTHHVGTEWRPRNETCEKLDVLMHKYACCRCDYHYFREMSL